MNLRFKNFVNLSESEIKIVFEMRNADEIRFKMYNQEKISFETHKNWIYNLKSRVDAKYFLVYADEKIIGVIDFTSISEDKCEWGYYLVPHFINSGLGILLEYYVIKYAFEILKVGTLFCAVLDSNKTVYDTHIKYFDFTSDERYSFAKQTENRTLYFKGLSISKEKWQNWDNFFVKKSLHFFKVEDMQWN